MLNVTQVTFFKLNAYFDVGSLKYLYFVIIMSLHVSIVCSNVLLIVVISTNRSLHEPMYILLCSLFVNELFGSMGLFPFLLIQILSEIHTIYKHFCFLQIFSLYFYVNVEFFTLASMSYDRYQAICHPLRYNTRMTKKKVAILIVASWLTPFLSVLCTTILSASLQLCGNVIQKVFCDNFSVVKLSCNSIRPNNIYGLITSVVMSFVPTSIIFYSYIQILKICFSGSSQTRQKAVSTCTPQIASILNFFFGVCFEVLQSRFNMSSVSVMLQILMSLFFLTTPLIFNPVMFGLKMSSIRNICKNYLFGRKV